MLNASRVDIHSLEAEALDLADFRPDAARLVEAVFVFRTGAALLLDLTGRGVFAREDEPRVEVLAVVDFLVAAALAVRDGLLTDFEDFAVVVRVEVDLALGLGRADVVTRLLVRRFALTFDGFATRLGLAGAFVAVPFSITSSRSDRALMASQTSDGCDVAEVVESVSPKYSSKMARMTPEKFLIWLSFPYSRSFSLRLGCSVTAIFELFIAIAVNLVSAIAYANVRLVAPTYQWGNDTIILRNLELWVVICRYL